MGLSVCLCSVSHWGCAPARVPLPQAWGWIDALVGCWPGAAKSISPRDRQHERGAAADCLLHSDININIYINIIAAVIFYSTCFIQLGLFDA